MSIEEYGLQLNISTNAEEVQKSIQEIKKLLDDITRENLKISFDNGSLKALQDTLRNVNLMVGDTVKQQVANSNKSINDLLQSINKSAGFLKGKDANVYDQYTKEIEDIRSELQRYKTTCGQVSEAELDGIRARINAIKELASQVDKSVDIQVAGGSRVGLAYTKMAQALMQIDNINTKASNYAVKSETDRHIVDASIESLVRQKAEIQAIMDSTSRLGNLSEKEYMRIMTNINNASNALSKFQTRTDKVNSLKNGVEKQGQALNKVRELYEKLGTTVINGNNKQVQSYKAIKPEIDKIAGALSKASSQSDLKKINTDIDKVKNNIKNLTKEVNEYAKGGGIEDFFNRGMSYFTGRMMYEASAMISRSFKDLINSSMEFNQQITEMAMVTGKTVNETRKDFETYNEMAKELKVTTQEIGDAMIEFVRQGLSLEQAMNRSAVATQFAKAAAIDFTMSAELLTASFNSHGGDAEENFLYISDVLLELGRSAGTSAEEVAVAMQKSASLASQSGVNLAELGAMISTVSEKTRASAESIGTSFASMMSRYGNMTLDGFSEDGESINYVAEALKQVNIQIKDKNGWKSYSQILKEVGEIWKELQADVEAGGEKAKIAQDKMNLIATQLSGTRQKNTFVGLMENYDRYVELIEVANTASGSTLEQYSVYLDSTEASINSIKASWESLILAFSNSNVLDGLLGAASNLMEKFSQMPALGTVITASMLGIAKVGMSVSSSFTKAVAEAIKLNMQTHGMKTGQAVMAALGANINGVGIAYSKATITATAFNAVATLGIGLAIGLISTLIVKLLDTESKTRKLNESFRKLGTSVSEMEKIDTLRKKIDLYDNLKENAEERYTIESEIKALEDEVAGYSEEYKSILDNENLSLQTKLALLQEIAREKAEESAREAKEEFLKNNRVTWSANQYTGEVDTIDYYDRLVAKSESFNAKKQEQLNLEQQIKDINDDKSLSEDEKVNKLKTLNDSLIDTKDKAKELATEILKTDSQLRDMNKSLKDSEKLKVLDDDSIGAINDYMSTMSNGIEGATGDVEDLGDTIDDTTQKAKELAGVLKGKDSEIDFISKMIKEYKEYGKIGIDTGAELIEKYEHLIPLLEDEATFVAKATEERKRLEEESAKTFNEYIDGRITKINEEKETSDTATEGIIKNHEGIDTAIESGANDIVKNYDTAYNTILRKGSETKTNLERLFNGMSINPKINLGTSTSSGSILAGNATLPNANARLMPAMEEVEEINSNARGKVEIGILEKPSGSSSGGSSSNKGSGGKGSSSSAKKTVEDLKLVIDKFQTLNQKIDNVNNSLEKYEILAENANPKDRLEYLQKEIELYEKKKKLLIDLYNAQQKELASLKKQLTAQGFIIDNQGVITNYETQLNKLQANANKLSGTAKENAIERVKELEDIIKEFVALNNEIQDTDNSIAEMGNTIYDALREQVELIADMEKQISEILKKQVEERKDLIDEELEKRKKLLEAEKESYNKKIEEENYEANLKSEKDKLLNIQAQIDKLSKDNSLNGKKKLEELKQQLADQQKVIDDMVKQNEIDKNNALFDAEMERLEAEAEAAKEKLDEEFSEEKIYQIAQQALKDGVFKDVNGKIVSVQDAFLEFEDKFGDGLTSLGSIIKQELINNLETAKGLFNNLSSILDKMGITNLGYSSNLFSGNSRMTVGNPNLSTTGAYQIAFNSPLINIEGNADKGLLNDLENMANTIKDTIYDEIASELRMRGV